MVIIWPLKGKVSHPLFLQQRPRLTGGLMLAKNPTYPWDDADRPPSVFSVIDRPPIIVQPPWPTLVPGVIHPLLPKVPTFLTIAGQTKDATGVPLGNCTVDLFETTTDFRVETTVSNGDGYYYFKSPVAGRTYYAVAYKVGSPDVEGTTDNTLGGV